MRTTVALPESFGSVPFNYANADKAVFFPTKLTAEITDETLRSLEFTDGVTRYFDRTTEDGTGAEVTIDILDSDYAPFCGPRAAAIAKAEVELARQGVTGFIPVVGENRPE